MRITTNVTVQPAAAGSVICLPKEVLQAAEWDIATEKPFFVYKVNDRCLACSQSAVPKANWSLFTTLIPDRHLFNNRMSQAPIFRVSVKRELGASKGEKLLVRVNPNDNTIYIYR